MFNFVISFILLCLDKMLCGVVTIYLVLICFSILRYAFRHKKSF